MKDSEATAIYLEEINKTFSIRSREKMTLRDRFKTILKGSSSNQKINALNDINLSISKGETFGIVGRNGSGKSTLLNIIMESILPDKGGIVRTNGRMIRLALGMGIDPNLTARENIYVNGSVIGLSFKKIGDKFDHIISFAGLEEFIDTPVKFFSKGMKQRLLFSIALHVESDIILLDEFFGGVGDQDFKKKSDEAFKRVILEGRTIVIVSHSLAIINKYCTRVAWIHKGKVRELGAPKEVLPKYRQHFDNMKKK